MWAVGKQETLLDIGTLHIIGKHHEFDSYSRIIHPDDLEPMSETRAYALERKEAYVPKYRIHRPDGSLRSIRARGQAFYGADGKPMHMMGYITDVTDRS